MSETASRSELYDVAIIGGGPGGYVAAIRAGQLGLRTVLVEREHMGGVCLNWGCIPTKALLHHASVVDLVKRARDFGITFDNLKIDYSVAVKRSRQAVQRIQRGVDYLMKKNNVEIVEGTGSLAGPDRIKVEPGNREILARYIILSTGARPRSLPGVEIDGERIVTSRQILDMTEVPRQVAIIGGGAIGAEFASLFRSYGAEVTIIELEPRLLPGEDPEISDALAKAFERRGIRVRTGSRVEGVTKTESGVQVHLQQGDPIEADRVLIAIGVQPNVESLSLENAGVRLNERGMLQVNEFMQTNVPNIYAIGDVAGPPYLAHVASEEGVLAVEHLAGRNPKPLRYEDMPRVTFCTPQVASLGLTEEQAREKGYEVKVGTFPFRGIGRATAVDEREGFCKMVVDAKYEEILGVHMIGPDVTELLAEIGLARTVEATVDEIAATVHPHPTLSEILKEAALATRGEALHI